jgi:predicted RNA-binding protein with PUA-like domain
MNYWLVKSEPSHYSFDQLREEKETAWTGIRNYAARLHLRAMKKGDLVFFYHSNEDLAIVGMATVVKEAYPDPTAREGDWSAVDIRFKKKFRKPVSLNDIKKEKTLANMALVRISRLSTQPVTADEWKTVLKMAGES